MKALDRFFGCLMIPGGIGHAMGFVLSFGVLIGNLLDFRALVNLITTLSLAAFSLRTALLSRQTREAGAASLSTN
jgi:predicted MFS family arabinose efflux permease